MCVRLQTLHKKWIFPLSFLSLYLLKKSLTENVAFCAGKLSPKVLRNNYGIFIFGEIVNIQPTALLKIDPFGRYSFNILVLLYSDDFTGS